jgi:5-dehydro-4-deoxyglucarate dehydratase
LLSFPVTHFDSESKFDEDAYREHCSWLLEHEIAGMFAAGGTGEFFTLTTGEVERVCRAAVAETRGRVPVIAGCGYGTAMAVEMAQSAERAGADGILLMPPYLITPSQAGLAAHVKAVCKATALGVIVYNRDNAVLTEQTLAALCEQCPNLVGFKDGVGDIELMMRVYAHLGDRLTYIGGLPTAEVFAMPYLEMGVTTYSSAIFNFLPAWALEFYRAVRDRDHDFVIRELNEFVLPYVALRNRGRGYAVAIVKAGMTAVGRHAGSVRAPLTDLAETELSQLKALIATRHARATRAETSHAAKG